jgi:predicted enzyme related to lactoylglutathione lyase
MHDRDWYPAGVPCWIDTAQPDPDAAAAFYGGLFGWEFEDGMPAAPPPAISSAGSVGATWLP